MDRSKPYIYIERGAGDTGAIHLVMPDDSRIDVAITRTEKNATAFDYFSDKLKDGMNLEL
jgi:hypothetical protein